MGPHREGHSWDHRRGLGLDHWCHWWDDTQGWAAWGLGGRHWIHSNFQDTVRRRTQKEAQGSREHEGSKCDSGLRDGPKLCSEGVEVEASRVTKVPLSLGSSGPHLGSGLTSHLLRRAPHPSCCRPVLLFRLLVNPSVSGPSSTSLKSVATFLLGPSFRVTRPEGRVCMDSL